jgi:tetratricopeptide (TPR) repeat protein
MINNFAELLEVSGYTEAQIERYFKLVNRKRENGLNALTISDRRYLLKARADVDQPQKKLDEAIKHAANVRVSGRQPVENKLHYRWIETELEIARQMIELQPGEVSAFVVYKEEYLRALSKYQPVLDQIDTSKRSKFNPSEAELLDIAASLGRVAPFDKVQFGQQLAEVFNEAWNDSWSAGLGSNSLNYGAVIRDTDELEFRQLVRDTLETLTREVYPSVATIEV